MPLRGGSVHQDLRWLQLWRGAGLRMTQLQFIMFQNDETMVSRSWYVYDPPHIEFIRSFPGPTSDDPLSLCNFLECYGQKKKIVVETNPYANEVIVVALVSVLTSPTNHAHVDDLWSLTLILNLVLATGPLGQGVK